jgi:hypothetical protein
MMASSRSAAGDGMPDPVAADSERINRGNQQGGEKQVPSDEDRVK